MAHPRRVVPGATYLLTRRVYQRTFRLRPEPRTNAIFEYCLGYAAALTGVQVHAFVVMSNHHHLVVTDVMGRLPEFAREFHRLTAKALNATQGQWENLWSAESYSAVRLPARGDVLDKIAYVVANPVAAGLVDRPGRWPGVLHWKPGTRRETKRPDVYFDPNGGMPKYVEFAIVPPPYVHDEDAWEQSLSVAAATHVEHARREVERQGLRFLGAAAVRKKSFSKRATRYEEKRRINPVVAARNISIRVAFISIEQAFRSAYREALRAWCGGDRSQKFPAGTWRMRVLYGVAVEPPG